MNILYVGDKYDYMSPEQGMSYGYYIFYHSLVAMNGGRNHVVYFAADAMIQKEGKKQANTKLLEAVEKEKPQLVFFAVSGEIGDIFEKETVRQVSSKKGVTTVAWMSDDQWAFETISKHWAPYFTWVITTNDKSPEKYKKIGYTNVIKSQWACNHWLYKKLSLPKIYDVSFVGRPHGNRKDMIAKIQGQGIQVQCWGPGWQNGGVSQEQRIAIFSQSKICLNFTKNAGVLWKELLSLFVRRRMHDRKILVNPPARIMGNIKTLPAVMWNNQIKSRNFEIPGCGSFCLTEYANDMESYYELGKEIECFSNAKEAAEKIRYYLEHEQEREAVAKAGYERTLKDHTYEKRFNELFTTIGLAASTI